ncbi:MAG: prephenate dehydrogenase/arogenate dehydrogenase family protein [Nanoarchaeota archaeon]|nr:prephenate dehydrogenase/arogenate dehydrogenase family protein [Nanoarchaeota archaeon]
MKPSIGIIGQGRFGTLAKTWISSGFKVVACDKGGNLEKACKQDIVLLCVPISSLEDLLHEIRPFLRPGTLVIDVCSVKEHPMNLMRKLLPKSVSFIGTHPLFGPDSIEDSLQGKRVVVCKGSAPKKTHKNLVACLKKEGLKIIESTPQEHDRQMAETLLLTQFVGRGLLNFGAKPLPMSTNGHLALMEIARTVGNDTPQLFRDMNRFNRFAAPMRKKLLKAMHQVDEES